MKNVLLIDFGSTYTKVTAVDMEKEELMATAAAYTTVQTDINEGLGEALKAISAETGCTQWDKTYACSSAAGGLKMAACGLVPELTAEAARQAALGAGAKVQKVFSFQLTEEDAREIEDIRPDIFLLTGGTDGGNQDVILENARTLAGLKAEFPIIIAGNRSAAKACSDILTQAGKQVIITENVMPRFNELNIEPAQSRIREIFLDRIIKAKGLSKASQLISGIMMPTPAAVLLAMELLSSGISQGEMRQAKRLGSIANSDSTSNLDGTSNPDSIPKEEGKGLGELLAVDVGGATTDIYSMTKGLPDRAGTVLKGLPEPFAKRTVEGDIGMRYSAEGICQVAGMDAICQISGLDPDKAEELLKLITDKTDTLPTTDELKKLDFALAAMAVKIGITRHAGQLEKVYTPVGETYVQSGKDLTRVGKVIITGGSLIHAERVKDIGAYALFDPANPTSLKPIQSEILVDKKYILSAMGLLSQYAPTTALKIMKKELISYGTAK